MKEKHIYFVNKQQEPSSSEGYPGRLPRGSDISTKLWRAREREYSLALKSMGSGASQSGLKSYLPLATVQPWARSNLSVPQFSCLRKRDLVNKTL